MEGKQGMIGRAPDVSVVSDGRAATNALAAIATPLRRAGISVETSWSGKIKSQMKRATGSWVVICEGERVNLRYSHTGLSRTATANEVVEGLLDLFLNDESDPTPLIDQLLGESA